MSNVSSIVLASLAIGLSAGAGLLTSGEANDQITDWTVGTGDNATVRLWDLTTGAAVAP